MFFFANFINKVTIKTIVFLTKLTYNSEQNIYHVNIIMYRWRKVPIVLSKDMILTSILRRTMNIITLPLFYFQACNPMQINAKLILIFHFVDFIVI